MEPPNSAIDMRRTKLKASEAALIAGELVKPTWASRNEGIHERISFEDTLWGFEMAGGAYYKTPLRVAYVRPGSRAEHACIRMGDTVLRINGRDTSDLTLQEAHQLVLDAGINLKIVVTSPDDKVNAHYDYEDPIVEEPELTPEQLKQMELERVRRALERASRCRDLPWPWVRRKWVIYRESNCFMVPSKYENKHKDKFPELPAQRLDYFYPVEKKNQANNKNDKNIKENTKTPNGNLADEVLNEDEEYEEIEEEVEVDEEEEKGDSKDENFYHESDKILGDKIDEKNSIDLEYSNSNFIIEDNKVNELDLDSLENNTDENLQRKDSNQSSSSYELDNNNNHVSKHKNEKLKEEIPNSDHKIDDKMINEIVENSNGIQDNLNDDDIINSVLNDDIDSHLENER